MDDLAAVRFALAAISEPHEGSRGLRSALFDLEHDIAVAMSERKLEAGRAASAGREDAMNNALELRGRLMSIYAPARVASDMVLLLLMVAFRLDWYRALREGGALERRLEEEFVLADIVLFFAEARSLCDRLAELIARSAKQRGVVSDSSLNDIKKWVVKNSDRAPKVLDARVIEQLSDLHWFTVLRDARGDITHRNRQMLKLNAGDHRILLYLAADSSRESIRVPRAMMQGVAVDFGMYAAVDERVLLVGEYMKGEQPMTELCRQFGVSRKTAYKWLARYTAEGPVGLKDRSRALRTFIRTVWSKSSSKRCSKRAGRTLIGELERSSHGWSGSSRSYSCPCRAP